MERRTASERRAMVAKFLSSELSQVAFAAKYRIHLGTLTAWIYHPNYAQEEAAVAQNRSVEIWTATGISMFLFHLKETGCRC